MIRFGASVLQRTSAPALPAVLTLFDPNQKGPADRSARPFDFNLTGKLLVFLECRTKDIAQ